MTDIVVIGSLNMDLVMKTPRMPALGETIRGEDIQMSPGGKGANQAAAAAKLGNSVALVGKVGLDAFGVPLIENLIQTGVDVSRVEVDANASTGAAVILVDQSGQNSIVISPGANDRLSETDLANCKELIINAKILLLQFEIPLKTVAYAMQIASENHVKVILNPAPARKIERAMYPMVDILVPNETELQLLTGMEVKDVNSAKRAGLLLLDLGIKVVIVTLGEKGALLLTADGCSLIPAVKVKVVDTTAAGDAFIGGLASGLIMGLSLVEAISYGCATGSLTVTKLGAQISLPTKAEVDSFYREHQLKGYSTK